MMKVIGFAGTAKNTGKTTAASRVLALLREKGLKIAVTSIGYDGENIDNVTGLPKPLYHLSTGDIIATAAQCLKAVKISAYRVLEETGIQTILGAIHIVEILKDDTYMLAGPNKRTDLEQVLKLLAVHDAEYVLIDGALNRIVPMICADGIVLSTGAAYDESIEITAIHAAGIAHLFTYTKVDDPDQHKNIHLLLENGAIIPIHSSSLITKECFEKIRAHFQSTEPQTAGIGVKRLTIPGACYPELLQMLLDSIPFNQVFKELVLGNPLFLIASGDPVLWKQTLQNYGSRGIKIGYRETLPLLFMTVNPFFPRYFQSSHSYEPAYVDAQRIKAEITTMVSGIPVVNIEEISNPELLSLLC